YTMVCPGKGNSGAISGGFYHGAMVSRVEARENDRTDPIYLADQLYDFQGAKGGKMYSATSCCLIPALFAMIGGCLPPVLCSGGHSHFTQKEVNALRTYEALYIITPELDDDGIQTVANE